jgi:hypothetical protein
LNLSKCPSFRGPQLYIKYICLEYFSHFMLKNPYFFYYVIFILKLKNNYSHINGCKCNFFLSRTMVCVSSHRRGFNIHVKIVHKITKRSFEHLNWKFLANCVSHNGYYVQTNNNKPHIFPVCVIYYKSRFKSKKWVEKL